MDWNNWTSFSSVLSAREDEAEEKKGTLHDNSVRYVNHNYSLQTLSI